MNSAVSNTELEPFELSDEHVTFVKRKRRIVVNHQVDGLLKAVNADMTIPEIMEYEFAFADEAGTHIDARVVVVGQRHFRWIGHNLIDANSHRPCPGTCRRRRSRRSGAGRTNGVNIAEAYIEETRRSRRPRVLLFVSPQRKSLLKNDEEPAAPIPAGSYRGEWDQPLEELRGSARSAPDKVAYFRELVERYDFDGLEADFARGTILTPCGHQWEMRRHRHAVPLYEVRQATLEVERAARTHPVLLAVRDPRLPGRMPLRRTGRGHVVRGST